MNPPLRMRSPPGPELSMEVKGSPATFWWLFTRNPLDLRARACGAPMKRRLRGHAHFYSSQALFAPLEPIVGRDRNENSPAGSGA